MPDPPPERDSLVQVKVTVRNRGLGTIDSTDLILKAHSAEKTEFDFQQISQIGAIGYADTVIYPWPGKDLGWNIVVLYKLEVRQHVAQGRLYVQN